MAYIRDDVNPLELQHQALCAERRQVVEEARLLRSGLVMRNIACLNAKERELSGKIEALRATHPCLLR